jgi:hypothetical protein
MVCSSSLGTGITDNVFSVTFKSEETGLALNNVQEASTACRNDQIRFVSTIKDFEVATNE